MEPFAVLYIDVISFYLFILHLFTSLKIENSTVDLEMADKCHFATVQRLGVLVN